jgi:hypothetical protein
MGSERIVPLPDQWVTEVNFEQALRSGWGTLSPSPNNVTFGFPPNCKIMVDAAVRLLSLVNQLTAEGVQITFVFGNKQHDALSYLNRANFFRLLSEQVQILPARPDSSLVAEYLGQSPNLVEFRALQPGLDEAHLSVKNVPSQLANALDTAMGGKKFGNTPYTLFSELMNNLYNHSQTGLAGFAALQVYRQGHKVQVVVSDSGIGLLETLKPKLHSSQEQDLEDTELVRLLFNGDLAWENAGNGQGLQECARQALKYQGSVSIRLSTCSVHLRPSLHRYEKAQVQYQQNLIPLKGTHICFSFPLD